MTACPRCGVSIDGTCPICDWQLATAPEIEEALPRRDRYRIIVASGLTVAVLASLFVASIVAYVRG